MLLLLLVAAACAGCIGSSAAHHSRPVHHDGHLLLQRVSPSGSSCSSSGGATACAAQLQKGPYRSASCDIGDPLCDAVSALQRLQDAGHYWLCLSTKPGPGVEVTGRIRGTLIAVTVESCNADLPGPTQKDARIVDRAAGL